MQHFKVDFFGLIIEENIYEATSNLIKAAQSRNNMVSLLKYLVNMFIITFLVINANAESFISLLVYMALDYMHETCGNSSKNSILFFERNRKFMDSHEAFLRQDITQIIKEENNINYTSIKPISAKRETCSWQLYPYYSTKEFYVVKSCERNTISMQEEPVDKNVTGSLLCI